MTPTYRPADLKRISSHFKMTKKEFFDKWLMTDEKNGDIVNSDTPCQFLNLKTKKCKIYAIRPEDCSGFPHHLKKKFDDYNNVYEQNLDKCPATLNFISRLKTDIESKFVW